MGYSSSPERFYADLHIHSRYSRACSRDCDLPNLARAARRKGTGLLGTGDVTHPAWYEHLRETLIPAEPGLYRLRDEAAVDARLPKGLRGTTRFMLSVEISTIYKRDGRTRKVHHLVYLPDLAAAARFNTALGRVGNLGADGRPILGLDSRDLLEIVLTASPHAYLVPAHIWTPWFSVLGSKSGFDAVADCYADLAEHVFAVETGLSSDPEMNWRVSALDGYSLVSNSDAHSPPALGREATLFHTAYDYYAIRDALRTGDGLAGTVEFFPEEGKYHADGHRTCRVRVDPGTHDGTCTVCGKPLTIGVLARVGALADRPAGVPAPRARSVRHLVPLPEVLGEIHGVGPRSKTVATRLDALVAELGPELAILADVPVEEVTRAGGELLGEAVARLRRGNVHRQPGFDGEYGVIRLFDPGELRRDAALFEVPAAPPAPKRPAQRRPVAEPVTRSSEKRDQVNRADARGAALPAASPHEPFEPMLLGMEEVGAGLLDRLDAMQRVAASAPGGPLLIVAGPGTGKTRTLTHRIAYLVAELGVRASQCLAITFTRRAAEELADRLRVLLPDAADAVAVNTFHGLGLRIIRDQHARLGLTADFRVAGDAERAEALAAADLTEADLADAAARERFGKRLRERDLVDVSELVRLPTDLLDDDEVLLDRYRARWPWVFVDEYQDVDAEQYRLLTLLCPPDGDICAIGDPDQAIYSFRGADVRYFLRFAEDFVDARTVRLTRNYRSAAPILAAAAQAIAPGSLVRGRILEPARRDPDSPLVSVYAAASVEDEADQVVRTIEELVGGSSHHAIDSGRSAGDAAGAVGFGDVAVLYRTDAQAAPVVAALERAGIPVQKRSHDRLTDRPGVRALARELPYVAGTSVAERLSAAARALGDGSLAGAGVDPVDVHTALDLLRPLAARSGDDPAGFLTALRTGAEVDTWDPRADRVTLLTMHAAKGLEFGVVFLIGCEDGLLPFRRPGSTPTDAEYAEERRLFFVGMTRAQDRLYLSHVGRRRDAPVAASPYLDAIDASLLARRGGPVNPRQPRDRQLRLL